MVKPTDTELRISGGLTNIFIHCDTCLSDEYFNRLRHNEFIEKENHILYGQLGNSVTGVIERGSVTSNSQSKQAQERETKERQTAQIVELVEKIRASIERMEADIKALEDSFQKRDGDAWREKLALKILGEDDIPQQEPGEDISAYRKRLEQHLINEMLNADGSIKTEYINHPELGDYAEWAQKQYHLNNARAIAVELDDGNTSSQRREQILHEMKERDRNEEMMLADRESTLGSPGQSKIKDIANEAQIEKHSDARSPDTMNVFLKPIG